MIGHDKMLDVAVTSKGKSLSTPIHPDSSNPGSASSEPESSNIPNVPTGEATNPNPSMPLPAPTLGQNPPVPPAGMVPPPPPGGFPPPGAPGAYPAYPSQPGFGAQPIPNASNSMSAGQNPYPQTGYEPLNQIAGYPVYPGNSAGYPGMKKPAGDFALALKAICPTFTGMHKSEGQLRVKANSQLKYWWWVMMLLFALVAGLSSSVLLARSADIFSGGILGASGYGTYSVLYFAQWLLCFVIFTLVAFAAVILRALLALAAARTKQTAVSFTQVASIVATGLVLPTFVLSLMFLSALLPIPVLTTIVILVLQLLLSASFLMMELLVFGGLKDLYPKDKSPEMRHTVFFVIWTLCASLIIGMFAVPTGSYALYSSAKSAVQDSVQNELNNLNNLERLFGN